MQRPVLTLPRRSTARGLSHRLLATGAAVGLAAALLPGSGAGAATPTEDVAPTRPAGVQATAAASTGDATPVPAVSLIPTTATSYPFGSALHQRVPQELERYGFVEEEYLVSGTANVYDWPEPGPAEVRTSDVPYATRVLVRRPADGKAFSGKVVVEMLNPSNLFDLNIGWALSHNQFLRDGDIWVGVTAKPVAIDALKNFDSERYGSLTMANPLSATDPRNCAEPNTMIAGDSSQATENGLVWDMHSQVAAWLRSSDPTNPVRYGASEPSTRTKYYGFGYSQTGGMLYTYINAIHPLDVQRNGSPLFDGYIVSVAGGAFAGTVPINQCAESITVDDPRNQIRNAGVPVIHIMSESDYLLGIDSRRPDSDKPGDQFRHYEVPGMGHATPDELYFSAAPEDIVKAERTIPSMVCGDGPRSRFRSGLVFDAAFRNLDRWVRHGVAPPRASRIKVVDGQGVRDRFGNLVGGYRTPYLEVPTATWTGAQSGCGFCFIAGYEDPFGQNRLERLYPTHKDYVRAVRASVMELVEDRFLTGRDGWDVIRAARFSRIPQFPSYPVKY